MELFSDLVEKKKSISVIGLGYVGLPLALEFAKKFKVIGFDINKDRIDQMKSGVDPSQELSVEHFAHRNIVFTSNEEELSNAHFHIVAVPTDIDRHKVPNLQPLKNASATVGRHLKKGDYVVFESTVFPGCTEEECLPIIEKESGLKVNTDFKLGYSPERIVPGEKVRTLTKILKIVAGSDEESLQQIKIVYGSIIEAGIHPTSSIKVAEAAKVIENTQRDLNISLMNELAIIFDKIGIDTHEVIEAASTKWNFHKYYPGLVGGHCISVDPFYLLYKSKQLGHDPQVIAAGRRVNDNIPHFISKLLVQKLIESGKNPGKCKVLVQGITFKENVADMRNSKVIDLVRDLKSYSIEVHIEDPFASSVEVKEKYGLDLSKSTDSDYDAVIIAVAHDDYKEQSASDIISKMNDHPIIFDLKRVHPSLKNKDVTYWSL